MIGIVRMELIRLRRPGLVLGWLGLTAMFAALVNFVMFQAVDKSGAAAPTDGPGVAFPSAARLLGEHGIVSGLSAGASFFGVLTLTFWALASGSDYSSGLIRIVASAEPRRGRLVVGKWIALALVTAATTAVAVVVDLVVAPLAASAGGWNPTAWGTDAGAVVGGAALNLFLSLLVWGTIGLALATLTRSVGVAVGIGLGYVLLFEAVVKAAASGVGDWLPGTTITALASGGTAALHYAGALAMGLAYVVVAGLVSLLVFRRRDIVE